MKVILFILCTTLLMSCGEVETYESEYVLLNTDSLISQIDDKLVEKIQEKDSMIHQLESYDSLEVLHIKELENAEQRRVRAIRELQDSQMSSIEIVDAKVVPEVIIIRDTTYLPSPSKKREDSIIYKTIRDTIYESKRKKSKRKKKKLKDEPSS